MQRQLWLINNTELNSSQAYDAARKEFYALRHEQEMERKVQHEEALWTGAYFGKGAVQVGMELEDKAYESWKAWATQQVQAMAIQRDSAYTGVEQEEEAVAVSAEDGEPAEGAALI